MRITYKGDYALKILLDLSLRYGKGLVQVKDISRRQDIPLKYLGQIILTLKGAGYIQSKRGHDGGVALAKSPGRIKVGEIIRLMDGTTSPITCVSRSEPSKCGYAKACPFRPLWSEVRDSINLIVDNTTFEDMAKRCAEYSKEYSDYSI